MLHVFKFILFNIQQHKRLLQDVYNVKHYKNSNIIKHVKKICLPPPKKKKTTKTFTYSLQIDLTYY